MRLREGDVAATELFVSKYEAYIRRTIRFRLNHYALQPAADSCDVCQSVLGSFLLRLSAGEYELQSEQDLRKLLTSIAKKKFLMLKRHESAAKRNHLKTESLTQHNSFIDYRDNDPAVIASYKELQAKLLSKLTEHERLLLQMRRSGMAWEQVSSQLQIDERVLRKRLSRAVSRVLSECGMLVDDEQ